MVVFLKFIDNLSPDIFASMASIFGIAVSLGATMALLTGAKKAGVLRRIQSGSLETEEQFPDARAFQEAYQRDEKARQENSVGGAGPASVLPFEVRQLSNYYSQILSQSKISFWFSLVFASIGFAVIVSSAFLYTGGGGLPTIFQFFAGVIVEAISALFFVQSRNAQKSMGEFFDKLRKDRLHMESRALCDVIQDNAAKDALRLHLSLHYANVGDTKAVADNITRLCLAKHRTLHDET